MTTPVHNLIIRTRPFARRRYAASTVVSSSDIGELRVVQLPGFKSLIYRQRLKRLNLPMQSRAEEGAL